MIKPTIILSLTLASCALAADTTVAKLYDSQLTGVEQEFVPLVKELPEPAFGFAPKQGAFQNVRTFAQQTKHVATVLYIVSAGAMGQKPPLDLGSGENGPDNIRTKAEIVKYLTDAFAYAHKAMNSLSAKSEVEMVPSPFGSGEMARGAIANIAITHTFDHYGQMVVYARMNNVIPPASR